jgi:hypothetical protein
MDSCPNAPKNISNGTWYNILYGTEATVINVVSQKILEESYAYALVDIQNLCDEYCMFL